MSSEVPAHRATPEHGRRRVVIENVSPQVDCGRFPAKRVVGDTIEVTADAFADGHELIAAVLRYREADEGMWHESRMEPLGNDAWHASFTVDRLGIHEFTVAAWTDWWSTWRKDLEARLLAGQDVSVDLLIGAGLIEEAARRASGGDASTLSAAVDRIRHGGPPDVRAEAALEEDLHAVMERNPDRSHETVYAPVLRVSVDPVLARFSTWYELFPRSTSSTPGRHGTFDDVVARLPYVAGMGFDVLYLPPIHPIGMTFRKGPNNVVAATDGDPGVPWAIGSAEGGHMSIHPDLGTVEDFRRLVAAAEGHGITIALDLAFQSSPDHPAVAQHPAWFRHRPDGTVQYAENPPKKYQDIYPFDFESEDWRGLWEHLHEVIRYWIDLGVTIFRVDNPHTKPFAFWEWAIGEIKRDRPDILFLAEAFTRPKVMYRLAKLGFDQSYTYFTWRNAKHEIIEYFTELTKGPAKEFFRPNLWPNTPDILHEFLQTGGRAAFEIRLILAATLGANYGIYGPAFELAEHLPLYEGSEEYLHSEKYEIRHWNLDSSDSLAPLIARINQIRRDHPALQSNERLTFHEIGDDHLLAYSRRSRDGEDVILVLVNIDPHHAHRAEFELPLWEWGIDEQQAFTVEDLLEGSAETWRGRWQVAELDPSQRTSRVWRVRRGDETGEQHR